MLAVTSPGFVLFAAVLAGLWFACPPPRRWQLMLGASLVFYAVLSWRTLPVLLASAFLVWWCARRAAEKGVLLRGAGRRSCCRWALLKYLPAALGWQGTLAGALGLGYFTLQLAGYLCDVRRGRILPEEKYLRLLCYASFFLSITQGPFNRYNKLMPQLDRPTKWDTARAWRGAQRSAWGYFKKFAVADRAAVVVDAVFANPAAFDRHPAFAGWRAVHCAALRGLLRLHGHCPWRRRGAGAGAARKLPPAILCGFRQGYLGAVAYQPVPMAAGLRLYPAGRQPVQRRKKGPQPDSDLPCQRIVARRRADVPRLGRPAWRLPGGGKPPGSTAAAANCVTHCGCWARSAFWLDCL